LVEINPLLFHSRLTEVVCNRSLDPAAVSIAVKLGHDEESDPEVDGDTEKTDYETESPAKDLPESE
jgi:hypothetical protein